MLNYHPVNTMDFGFNLDTSEIVAGKVYNFTVVIYVDPSLAGQPMKYVPSVSMSQGFITASRTGSPDETAAAIPEDMLPSHVTNASLVQYFPSNWSYVSVDVSGMTLDLVNEPYVHPSANFSANATFGTAPMAVHFTDTSGGSPTAWNWSFGDGGYSELRNPVYVYIHGGNYTVSLNASDSVSYDIAAKTSYINVDQVPSTLPVRVVPAGGTAYTGESGLNITQCMGPNTTLAWFAPGAPGSSFVPDNTTDVTGEESAFFADPAVFDGRTGTWYSWADGNTLDNASAAFTVADPAIDFGVWDYTLGRDVTGRAIPVGDTLGFSITSNLANISDERGMPASGKIAITGPGGSMYPVLTNTAGTTSVMEFPLITSTVSTGPVLDTGNAQYMAGTYAINVSSHVNRMLANYPVPGKTFSPDTTLILSRTPVVILPARW